MQPEIGGGAGAPQAPSVEAPQANSEIGGGLDASLEASIDTASQSLAASLQNVSDSQGPELAFAQLTQPGTETPEQSQVATETIEPTQRITDTPELIQPSTETVGQAEPTTDTTEQMQPSTETPEQAQPSTEMDAVQDQNTAESSEATQNSDQQQKEPQSDVESENAETEDIVPEVANEILELKDAVAEIAQQQMENNARMDAAEDKALEAITKIPGLVETLKALLEKATPEQKKKVNALMLILQLLLSLGASALNGVNSPPEKGNAPKETQSV